MFSALCSLLPVCCSLPSLSYPPGLFFAFFCSPATYPLPSAHCLPSAVSHLSSAVYPALCPLSSALYTLPSALPTLLAPFPMPSLTSLPCMPVVHSAHRMLPAAPSPLLPARIFSLLRQMQDAFSYLSHTRAGSSIQSKICVITIRITFSTALWAYRLNAAPRYFHLPQLLQ